MFKTLASASIALAMLAGTAVAQTGAASGGTSNAGGSGTQIQAQTYASDDEKKMYEENKASWAGFYTDETMATMKSNEEQMAAFNAMSPEAQAAVRGNCETVGGAKDKYGPNTASICTNLMGR